MAESAACPAFQLGRPRYDQVGAPCPPVTTRFLDILFFKAFG